MKYVKTFGLLAVAAATLMAFAGTAAATLTDGSGTAVTSFHAQQTSAISMTGSLTITCQKSTMGGDITTNDVNEAEGPITSLTFEECGNTFTVVKKGNLKLTAEGSNTATVRWSDAEMTVLLHSFLVGTVHCTYATPGTGTDIGTFTGSGHSGTTAKIDLSVSMQVDASTSDATCGEHSTWEGGYEFASPDPMTFNFAGTTVTSPKGTKLGTGTEIKAESEGAVEFAGTITFSCQKATMEGKISSAGGENATVSAELSKQTFTECGNHTVEVKKPGSLEVHSLENSDGTLTSTGAEITVLTHGIFLGTRHCIYTTEKTDLGTLTGSTTTGNTATLDVGPVATSQSATDANCGSAEWGGSYKVTTPDSLYVD